jgi:hypothetical protein
VPPLASPPATFFLTTTVSSRRSTLATYSRDSPRSRRNRWTPSQSRGGVVAVEVTPWSRRSSCTETAPKSSRRLVARNTAECVPRLEEGSAGRSSGTPVQPLPWSTKSEPLVTCHEADRVVPGSPGAQ